LRTLFDNRYRNIGIFIVNKLYIAAIAFSIGSMGITSAISAEPLNIKPGAWETTIKRTSTGSMAPPGALASLPPERREKMLEAMKAREGKTATSTHKSCRTKEDIERGQSFDKREGSEGNCKRTVVEATATKLVTDVDCTGASARAARLTVEAKTPELVITTFDNQMSRGGKMHVEMTSKWLGASCEGIKE
jgi:Protein of unknown function (DUF3617)